MKHARTKPRTKNSRLGFTLVELAIGSGILFLLAASLVQSIARLRGLTTTGSTQTQLQNMGEKAMAAIVGDLRRSGFANVGVGLTAYPHLFDDGAATGAYAIHSHPAASDDAAPGDNDYGPNREIVFVQPLDADDDTSTANGLHPDGIPDVDALGQRVWDTLQYSFVVVTHADGINYLERRTNGANPRVIAHHIERITFDDVNSDITLPLDTVRVRIWFREQDADGTLQRYFAEARVHLRNG